MSVVDSPRGSADRDGEAFWEFVRAPAATMVLIEIGRNHGMGIGECLAGTGIEACQLDEPDLAIEPVHELSVIRNLVHHCRNEPGLGVEAGKGVTVGMLGVWGLAMVSASTTREVIDIAARFGYGRFSWVFCQPTVEPHPDGLSTVFASAALPADLTEFVVARDLAFVLALLPKLLGARFPARVTTTLSGAHGAALSRAFPDVVIETGAARDEIVVPGGVLDRPPPEANAHALRTCERQCIELVAQHSYSAGTAGRVERALVRRPDRAALADIAEDMHVHPRTLSRRLEIEGTSFRDTRDVVHARLAVDFLTRAHLSVQQVATRLGYADVASFTRAFKRWTGETPGSVARSARRAGAVTPS